MPEIEKRYGVIDAPVGDAADILNTLRAETGLDLLRCAFLGPADNRHLVALIKKNPIMARGGTDLAYRVYDLSVAALAARLNDLRAARKFRLRRVDFYDAGDGDLRVNLLVIRRDRAAWDRDQAWRTEHDQEPWA